MKKMFFVFLCFQLWIGSEMNFFLIPVFPTVAQRLNIKGTLMGLILVLYGIAQLCSSTLMIFLDYSKIKFHLFFMCTCLLIIGNMFFAFLENSSLEVVLFFSFLGRIIHGTVEGINIAVGFSLVAELYPTEVAKYIAIFESFMALAFVISPIFSGFLSQFVGYTKSYLIITLIFLPSFPLIFYFSRKFKEIMSSNNVSETQPLNHEENSKNYFSATFKLFRIEEILLVIFQFSFQTMSLYLPDAGIYNHVKNIVGGEKFYVGTMISTACLGNLVSMIVFSRIIGKIKRKYFFILGTSLQIISLLLIGPEPYTFLEKKAWNIYLAYFISGISLFFSSSTAMPDFLETLKREGEIANEVEIQDRASGLSSFCFALGNILGELFGGIYIDAFGFRRAMSFQACFLFVYLLIFIWRKKNI